MPKQVRVKDPVSGAEFTTNEIHAESAGLTVLDKPAVDSFGGDLPPKYPVTKGGKPVVTNPEKE
jgi:hypothetical protein